MVIDGERDDQISWFARWDLVFSWKSKERGIVSKKKDDFCGLSLAYLSDIFELLNELNRKMQDPDNNVITHTDTV